MINEEMFQDDFVTIGDEIFFECQVDFVTIGDEEVSFRCMEEISFPTCATANSTAGTLPTSLSTSAFRYNMCFPLCLSIISLNLFWPLQNNLIIQF